ncbi:hypothetical protein I79_020927 [Cricetulus griseus]|uniref:Uncharacterized protein n=1 Tax=Cricetulus griseus TaxID=10029 RepID=G3IBA7_CRIGR|nr:hypothetical protein I79_020927 [Cricetulus griseus]
MEQRNEGLVLSVAHNLMVNGCPSRPLVLRNPCSTPNRGCQLSIPINLGKWTSAVSWRQGQWCKSSGAGSPIWGLC